MVGHLQLEARGGKQPFRPAAVRRAGQQTAIRQRQQPGRKPKIPVKVNRQARQNVFRISEPAFQNV
ncbi:hypothetical protein QTH97_11075 [Variovorax sp. J22R24]|uniref:hypothetical protein n=1 Tax=Variovorax gracilis TaxID=3053502 RepID=UPI002575DB87|nr:hypothetical protein [Variovorax sp. J22R24]MDM0105478.1 hypothetical protein [Variovorax sp. J22R24]